MITNHFCACGLFSQWNIRQNYFVFVEFWTTFFRVSTCFNGSDGFVTVEFGENGHFAANLAPETMWIDFFFLTGSSDVNSDSSDAI